MGLLLLIVLIVTGKPLFAELIKVVQYSDSGDQRMAAAHYISKFDTEYISSEKETLLQLMDDEWDSVAVPIMMALSRIKSQAALEKIINNRIKQVLPREAQALQNYLKED